MIGKIALWTLSSTLAANAAGLEVRSGTYTPSGKMLLSYQPKGAAAGARDIRLATMNDDGSRFRPFFAGRVPDRAKDNGIRFMVFPDNRRVFLGDFVLECRTSLETCRNPQLLPVAYSGSESLELDPRGNSTSKRTRTFPGPDPAGWISASRSDRWAENGRRGSWSMPKQAGARPAAVSPNTMANAS